MGLLFGSLASCLHVPEPLGGQATVPAPEGPPASVEEVLARYVRAVGGAKALRAIRARTTEARLTFLPDEGCREEDPTGCLTEAQQGRFLLITTADGRLYRRNVVRDVVEERGFDGTQGWQVLPDGAVRIDPPDERAALAEDAQLHWYFDPAKRGVRVEMLPPRTVEDPDGGEIVQDGLAWHVPGVAGPPKTLWFDRATGLLAEEVVRDAAGPSEEGDRGAPVQTIRYLHYRTVDGVRVPDRIELATQAGSLLRRVRFFTYRVDHGLVDDARFAPPDPVPRPKPVDPLRLALVTARVEAGTRPKDAEAQVAWARAAHRIGAFPEAERAARAALALDPSEPEALYLAAHVALARGDLRAAERMLRRAEQAGLHPARLAELGAVLASHRGDAAALAEAHRRAAEAGAPSIHRTLATRFASLSGRIDRPLGPCGTEVPLEAGMDALVFPLEVDGKAVHAMLDTGAADLILDARFADEAGIVRLVRDRLPGGGEVSYGRAGRVGIGDVAVANVPVEVFPAGTLDRMTGRAGGSGVGPEVSAIVGLRMLAGFRVQVDRPAGMLRLAAERPACRRRLAAISAGRALPLWIHDTHYAYVAAAMGDRPGLFLVNTGMRGMDLAASRDAYGRAGVAPPVIDPRRPAVVRVPRLAVGPVVLTDLTGAYGYFERDRTSGGFRVDGMLGHRALSDRPWTVSFATRTLYLPQAP